MTALERMESKVYRLETEREWAASIHHGLLAELEAKGYEVVKHRSRDHGCWSCTLSRLVDGLPAVGGVS